MHKKNEIVLFPPKIRAGKFTDKYQLHFVVEWGENQREIKVNREQGNEWVNTIDALNAALVDLSELKPYTV